MMYQYFVKIVPTIYVKTDGEVSTIHPDLTAQLKSAYNFIISVAGVKNKPVFSDQAREGGQRSDRGPGAARGICLI